MLFDLFVQPTSVVANMPSSVGRDHFDERRHFLPFSTVRVNRAPAMSILWKALDRVCRSDETAMNFKCRPSQRRSARDDGRRWSTTSLVAAVFVAVRRSFGHNSRNFTRKCWPIVCPTFTQKTACTIHGPELSACRACRACTWNGNPAQSLLPYISPHVFSNSSGWSRQRTLRLRLVHSVWMSRKPVRSGQHTQVEHQNRASIRHCRSRRTDVDGRDRK